MGKGGREFDGLGEEVQKRAREVILPFMEAGLEMTGSSHVEVTSDRLLLNRRLLELRWPVITQLLNSFKELSELVGPAIKQQLELRWENENPYEKSMAATWRRLWGQEGLYEYFQLLLHVDDCKERRKLELRGPREVGVHPLSGSAIYVWEQAWDRRSSGGGYPLHRNVCLEGNGTAVAVVRKHDGTFDGSTGSVPISPNSDLYETITTVEAMTALDEVG